MEDRFEKYIKENRAEFDVHEPRPDIWKRIEANIKVKRKIRWRLIIQRTAIVIAIFAASYGANELVHRFSNNGLNTIGSERTNKAGKIPGLRKAETYYTSLINQKMEELKPIIANCPSIEEELNYDISELDSVYHELKSDLQDNMDNQEVIEAIIENYRLKISILEDILSEIDPKDAECLSNKDNYAL